MPGIQRYAVAYKPGDSIDSGNAKERAEQMAEAWRDAMSSKDTIKDFVAVGDVSVKVIGADSGVLNSEVPVKQLMEQIIAKTGLPPYMLGLSWSTTERMSSQQADVLTTELEAYRRILNPVLLRIGKKYLEINGIGSSVEIVWDSITMQDETEMARRARLYDAQTEKILKGGLRLTDGYIEKGYTPVQDDFDKIRQFTRKAFWRRNFIFSLLRFAAMMWTGIMKNSLFPLLMSLQNYLSAKQGLGSFNENIGSDCSYF